MNCLIYLRVSTKEQAEKGHGEEGYSIPAQREACIKYAKEKGWHIVDEYTDRGESARSADRPQLQEMLSRVKKDSTIDTVLVHKIDRLARNMEDHVAIKAILKRHDVSLVSVVENIEDSASGRLVEGIHALMAEFYSVNLGMEAKKGMIQKAKQGDWPQKAPVGYLNSKEVVHGRVISSIIVDPVRGPIMTEVFKRYATGDYSLTELHAFTTQAGLTTIPTRVYEERPISRSTLAVQLQNNFYTGYFTWKDVTYKGNHEPLIDQPTFDRVQDIIRMNRVGIKNRKYPHYLKGSVHCAECGARMSIDKAKNHFYFYCLGRKQKPKCTMPYISVANVEKAVEDFYRGISLKPQWIDKIVRSFKKEMLDRLI
ncbi:MAG: recombinase family protein, partial [Actinobacteria bacterium]|nr:recombinase family protein [Actinomycetota bacterium]